MDESGSHEAATVLIIDDDAMLLLYCREILEPAGYRVLTAGDGPEGLALFRAEHETIDVAIVDWMLPHLDGRQWLDCLLAIDPEVRAIFITGYLLDEATRRLVGPKVSGFLKSLPPIFAVTSVRVPFSSLSRIQSEK